MAAHLGTGVMHAFARATNTNNFQALSAQSSLLNASVLPANTLSPAANDSIAVTVDLPFYASFSVLIYVASMCTAISWYLVIILLITPGQFLGLSIGNSQTWLRGRDMPTSVSARPGALISGSRPWLQKAAALLVAITMTLSSADTLTLVKQEYYQGVIDSCRILCMTSYRTDIRVSRVISNIFLLLAQVQTLIRLFPRQKEKLIIKWFGFLLILLDLIFSSLDSFWISKSDAPDECVQPSSPFCTFPASPVSYVDAISALSYLFELALSLLYAAWVFYYIGTKRRYAFVSSKMPNISLIAIFAIISVIIPICFFVVDISVSNAYGWGDFLRSVGGVAASVVVWEWVERVEALEQDEKKDGILGREIFDEDETFGRTAMDRLDSQESSRDGGSGDDKYNGASDVKWQHSRLNYLLQRFRPSGGSEESFPSDSNLEKQHRSVSWNRRRSRPSKLQPPLLEDSIAVPISRADTTSAVSTEYAVHYHPVAVTPPVKEGNAFATSHEASDKLDTLRRASDTERRDNGAIQEPQTLHTPRRMLQFDISRVNPRMRPSWTAVPNPFKRRKESPPLEVKQAMSLNSRHQDSIGAATVIPASSQSSAGADKHNQRWTHVPVKRRRRSNIFGSMTEPKVIPAPPTGHVWAPDLSSHSPAVHKSQGKDLNSSNHSANTNSVNTVTNLEPSTTPQGSLNFTMPKEDDCPSGQVAAHGRRQNDHRPQAQQSELQHLHEQHDLSSQVKFNSNSAEI